MKQNKKIGRTARTMLNHLVVNGPSQRATLLFLATPPGASRNWGNSYFLPAGSKAYGAGSSLLQRGYVMRIGRGVYAVTARGIAALHA